MNALDVFTRLASQPQDASALPQTAAPLPLANDRLDGWWSLLYRGWTLLAPSGVRIDLTEIERACFICLLRNPNRELLREELMTLRASTNLRTLNVAICRLRGKVLQTGIRLPLHTVHGVGYVFLGNLRELSNL
ncbi:MULTISPECIES: helix-turn-helix domain-containing protein [Achromobacter]|uniref:Helix-turn-helix domain-containing protein n=1 Tax=Achromobacter spanius TaxID=217203 RepID=A0ABY8GZ35_9BURK|nr:MULTISPECIES: helix-turn-helix domain-containing protein [Achromobacter]WAI86049.1 helix-turn-helix domain-containing protein [Achromobacter spanius]WEX96130.1 helix-turn-helix domain-containing protein [Achromobacter sp. SS2-2022]WFP10151.1 helix-turn-helix domain-containing protein [Achromobacter spanius]